MKQFLLFLMITIVLLLGGQATVKAQTTLAAGDIAIVRENEDNAAEGFSFVTLVPISGNTVIYFTDEGWAGTTWYGTSEGHFKYTAPSGGLAAGSVVHINEISTNTPGVSGAGGTVEMAWSSTSLNFSGGESIIVYQTSASSKPTAAQLTFIAGIMLNDGSSATEVYDASTLWTSSTITIATVNTCQIPTGLTNGTNCFSMFAGGSEPTSTFNVRYNCTLISGTKSELLEAINNKANWIYQTTGGYSTSDVCSFTVSSASPEMNITGNGTTIADGDATPSATDSTDFGSTDVASGMIVKTFTIQNTGTASLNLSSSPIVAVSGSSDFTVTTQPTTPVSAGSSVTFQVTFNPSGSGTHTATLSIANNDADENPYNFSIQGVGTAPEPEMKISGNSVEILDGDVTPSTSDYTDYGLADINTGSVTYTYTIENQGLAALTLSGSPIVSSSSSDFTVTQPPVSSIAAGGSTTFQVTFNPTATGTRTATLSIANNDSNENPYDFTLQGYGTSQNLSVGDIAFIGYNSDDPDGFTFITLKAIPSTEMIYFTEEGWNGSAWSGSSTETHYAWQAPAGGLSIGSIVYVYESSSNVLTASTGTISGMLSGSTFNFSGGDQVLAYQSGSGVKPTSPTFIAGLHADYFSTNYNSTTTWSQSASAGEQNASTVPTGLTNGVNCVSLFPATTEEDNAKYNGTLTGNSNAIRTAINTYTNWISKSDTYYDISPTGYTTPSITLAAEINLLGNSVTIADGDAIPSVTDDTDFGSVAVSGGTVSHTFTIQNTGSLTLNLTGTPIVSIPTSDFAVTTQPSGTTIASGGSLTFTVEFNPTAVGTRTATISIANDDSDENPYNFSIQGTGTNTAPSISISDITLSYTENAAATQTDATATLSDADGDADWNGGKLEVQITANNETADEISIPDNIVGTINTSGTNLQNGATVIGTLSASEGTVTNGTKLTITFNANATNALVQQVLRAIHYRNTSDTPGTSNRTITFTATDKNAGSSSDTRTVSITAVNDAPVLAAIEGTALSYTENAAATSITGTLTVSDVDNANMTSATVQITVNYQNGQDILSFTNQNGITGSWNVGTGIMSLSGSATKAFYETALRDVKYNNTSDNPNTSSRTVSFTVNDGDVNSNIQTRGINVSAVNDAPTLTSFAGIIETTTQNTEVEITLAELKAQGNQADVDGTVDAFIVNVVSTGTLKIGANAIAATPFNATTNKTINATNNAYWTPANNAYGTLNAFTTTVMDNNGDESTGAVQATVRVNDITAPSVSSITISGSPAVTAPSITFVVAFSEPVVNVSTDDFSLTSTGTAAGTIASVSSSSGTSIDVTVNSITGTGSIRLDLLSSTNIADVSLNTPPAAYASGSVHTVDLDGPALSSSIPIDGAAGVATSSNITLTFSENIAFGTGNIQIIDLDNGSSTVTINAASPGTQASISTNTLALNPTSDLEELTNYAIQIAATAIDDVYGNSYAGISDNTTLNFQVADITPPVLLSSTPSDNATNATLSGNIVLNFDDILVAGTGNVTIRRSSDDGIFEQIAITDSRITISGTQLTINPTGIFAKGTGYYIEIDPTALDDDAGNSFAGISGSSTLNFTTVDVVINEVVTEPQTDWSTNIFNGTNGGGSVSEIDEWVELFIKSSGIDLSVGWTLEVSSNAFSGSLNADGVFEISRYVGGTGSISNTASGSYLVLGNPISSYQMTNSTTITLKDPGGAVVDAVTLFNSSAPSANSDNIFNESAQRFPNGTDTDTNTDWTQGQASMGTANTGPSVSFNTASSSGLESVSSANLQVDLSAKCGVPVTVNYTVTGTATGGGVDYTLANGTLTIDAGTTSKNITIASIINDLVVEGDETVVVTLSSPVNATLGAITVHTYTITDDDVAALTIAATAQAEEDATDGEFTISTDKQFDAPVTVTFTVGGDAASGTDYTAIGTTVVFPAFSSTVTIPVEVIADNLVESDETVIVSMTTTSNSDVSVAAAPDSSATVTITDDDVAVLSIAATTQAEEDATDGEFTISTDKQFDAPVTVTFTVGGDATSGTDYTAIGTTVVFPAFSSTVTIPVEVIADNLVESDETVIVSMTTTSNSDVSVAAAPDSSATVTITDDDVAVLSIAATTQAEEDATDGEFTISTDKQFDAPVTVTFTVGGDATSGTDYTAIGTTVVFPAFSSTVTIPVEVIADNLVESDETVIVSMTATSNSNVSVAAAPDSSATVTIIDDDVAVLTIAATIQAEEDATDGEFTISTDKQFDAPVTVTFTVGGDATSGTDYTAIGTTVVFPAFSSTVTIPVEVIADNLVESDETVIVSMTTTSNSDVSVAVAPDSSATVTITDDDVAVLTIAATSQAEEDATDGEFTISTDKQFDAPVTVTFTVGGDATSGTDYTAIGTTVVFPAFSSTVTIPVEVIADNLVESDETVIVSMTTTSNSDVSVAVAPDSSATVTITDDDVAVLTIAATAQAEEDATDGEFTISTDKQFDAPVTVTFAVGGDAASGTDYTAIGTTVVFPAFSNTVTIPVEVIADNLVESDETVIVSMTTTSNSDVSVAAAPDSSATVTITDDDVPPTVTTTAASSITTTSAILGGNVTDGGSVTVTERGVVYSSTDDTPTIGETGVIKESNGDGTGTFDEPITSLSINTRYYINAYATNAVGTSYGTASNFVTHANIPGAPIVDGSTANSLNVAVNVNLNPDLTEFAIYETSTAKFVQANGSLGSTVVWQTAAQWHVDVSNTRITVNGLSVGVTYTFRVKARNADNFETDYGESTTGITCTNPTVAGTIGSDQIICDGSTPSPLTSILGASNYGGTLEYKWQHSTTDETTGFTDISDSDSDDFVPGTLTVTTWFKRLARVSCRGDWTGAVESNVVKITVDETPPVVSAKTGSTVTLDPTGNYTLLSADLLNSFSDAGVGVESVAIVPPTVNCTNLGLTTVTVTVTDSCGNHTVVTPQITVLEGSALLSPWISCMVGASNGTAIYSPCTNNGTFTLTSTGLSSSNADIQEFTYQTIGNTGTVIARVSEIENGGWLGVEMRESCASNAKTVLFKTRYYNSNVIIGYRTATGKSMTNVSQTAQLTRWMKIQRNGTQFTVYTSVNGTTWTKKYTATVSMSTNILAGIFTESVRSDRTSIAQFDHAEVSTSIKSVEILDDETIATGQQVDIYPNPADELVNIVMPDNEAKVKVTMTSMQGNVVLTTIFYGSEAQINTSHINPGVYVLRFETEGNVITKRLVIM